MGGRRRTALLSLALVLLTTVASAQSVERPAVKVGDRWHFAVFYTVPSAEPSRGLSFPLHVGKRWRFTTDWLFKAKGSRGIADVDVAVVGHETLTVPAGEFS